MAASSRGSRTVDREGEAPPPPEPLPIAVADAHCHLDLMGLPIIDALLAAQAVGVERIVTIGIDVETSRWAVEAAATSDDIFAAVAVHPNEAAAGVSDDVLDELAKLAVLPGVVAIGETGLDHFRTDEDGYAAQEESFRRHIALAKETDRTLVIHDRDAHEEVLRVLEEEGAPERTIFHCFSGGPDLARACADQGYLMSFAGNVTFKNADDLRAAASIAPADLLLVETDAPFLTPMPHRGRPNAPYLIPLTMRTLAQVRGEALDQLCADVAANWHRAFGVAQTPVADAG
jgi:TatD DNase family protein